MVNLYGARFGWVTHYAHDNIDIIKHVTTTSQHDLKMVSKNNADNNKWYIKSGIYFTVISTGIYITSATPFILSHPAITVPLILYGWYKF